jgi:hypothetical protein
MTTKSPTVLISETNNMSTLIGTGGAGVQLLSGTVNGNYGFTAVAVTDLITCTEHPFANDDIVRVRVTAGSTLPAGLSLGTDYYVIDSATDEFRLSLTAGGTTVDITDTGTGVFKVAKTDAALLFDGGSGNPLDIVNGQIVQITSFVYNPQI